MPGRIIPAAFLPVYVVRCMDTSLKQRLIGALVLIALAVIFLPMLIKGPAPDSGVSDVPLNVPAKPDARFETRELPLVSPGAAPAGGAVGMGSEAPAPVVAETPAAATPGTGSEPLPATTAAGSYAVSFGAYATAADADVVISRLRQSGLTGYRQEASINGRPAYRVRIGPFADRADAESARLQASRVRSDVNAQVIALDAEPAVQTPAPAVAASPPPKVAETPAAAAQPASTPPTAAAATRPATPPPAPAPRQTPAPAPAPATPPPAAAPQVGFAVQLGAFSNAADANALRDKARAAGFSASVDQVRTDKGTLSRVRVGPVASRADADKLKAQVSQKIGVEGMVRSHP